MYLSKILLNPMHPSARQALRDRHDLHRNVQSMLPGDETPEAPLYRIIETRMEIQLLILSDSMPEREAVESLGGVLQSTTDMTRLPELYRTGAVLRFSLLAAPSKKTAAENGGNSRRIALRAPEERVAWLSRQGEKYGFQVLECYEPSAAKQLQVGRKSGGFVLSAVELSGMLRIEDAERFWASWRKGIGPEKAYGLGLMLLSK